jgi:hypothetical protein
MVSILIPNSHISPLPTLLRGRFCASPLNAQNCSLLFQINLKHLKSISFLYFSGTTQALATYVNIGTIKDLIFKIFPTIVRFLFVHKGS